MKMFMVMKKWIFVVLLFVLGFGALRIKLPVRANGDPLVMLDEFVSYPSAGGEEWIELLNPNQDSALDLTGYRLVVHQGPEQDYTYFYEQNLSGSVPRGGFLTFATDNSARLPDDGACLVIFRDQTNSVYAVKYGNGVCDVGAGEQDASGVTLGQGKSVYYNLDESTWNSTSSPTRGWCNPGSGECPTISTITSQLTNENVATNLGDQTDFSRISGLYFQKSEGGTAIGRIAFLSEMNFTDRDALSWMQTLDTKISISQGIISLDADLIKNLTDTQASLTMYGITLNNPKILVNGQSDSAGIVSGLIYDRIAGSLTFTAAHFTTFTATEDTGSSGSNNPGSPSACGDWPPLTAPRLFQINTTRNSATLYFMPVTDYVSYYFIAYGYKQGDWRFGTQFNSTQKIGVINHTIKGLAPNTTYYFTVRAGNGCAPGKWSNYLLAKTEGASLAVKAIPTQKVLGGTDEAGPPAGEAGESKIASPLGGASPTSTITLKPEPTNAGQSAEMPISETTKPLSLWQKIVNFFKNLFR